jgi:uracil-DNA glycosylase
MTASTITVSTPNAHAPIVPQMPTNSHAPETNVAGNNNESPDDVYIPPLKPQPRNVELPPIVKSAHPFIFCSPQPPNQGQWITDISQLVPPTFVYNHDNAYGNILSEEIDQTWKVKDIARHHSLNAWRPMFNSCINIDVFKTPDEKLAEEEKIYGTYYPLKKNLFRAFELCPLSQVEVVIIGQDPYHSTDNDGEPTAQGMSFSARRYSTIPPSLNNIFKEIKRSLPDEIHSLNHADLTSWALQGVLLLNTCLTVRPGVANQHKGWWVSFINEVIRAITAVNPTCIYVLWGNEAQTSVGAMLGSKNEILSTSHPSPRSAYHGFNGCGHFATINEILRSRGKPGIDWNIV